MNIKKTIGVIALTAMIAVTSAGAATFSWTSSLQKGSRNVQVKTLQQYLNSCPDTVVATTGVGSAGKETTYFGPATKAAVIKWQAKNGVNAIGVFGPASRAKAAALLATTNPCAVSGSTTTTGGTTTTTPTQTGPVTVALASTTPAGGSYIIDNQAQAGLLDVTFTGNGTVTSVTLHRSGISDSNTLKNIYLYDGVNRLTDGYSFNTIGDIVINNLSIVVSGSKTISVKADAASNASDNSTIAVALTGFTAGTTATTATVQGNMMYLASGKSLATVAFNGSVTPTVGTTIPVNAGTTGYTFWSAPLQVNTRTVSLKSVAFRMIGSAPSDALSNIKLFVDGVVTGNVATISAINGSNYAVFNFSGSPVSLTTGSHTIDVRGDVQKGSSRTIQFSLQQAADLAIMDPQVGVNIAASGIPSSTSAGTISISSGSLTIARDSIFKNLTTITGGASNTAIGKYTLHAYGEDVKVQQVSVLPLLAGTVVPANGGLQNVTLYFNGSQVGTQQPWNGSTTPLTFTLGSQLIVPAGTDSTLEVRADLRSQVATGTAPVIGAGTNYTSGDVSATVSIAASDAQGQTSFNTLLSGVSQLGNALSIQTASLAVARANYGSQSVSPNTASVKVASFNLQNTSSSESVRITQLKVDLDPTPVSGTTTPITNLSSLTTSETSGSGSNPIQPVLGVNTFSVDFTLAPNATKTIDVLVNTGSTTGGQIVAKLAVSSIGSLSNVSATTAEVTGPTITISAGTLQATTIVASATSATQYVASATGAANATKVNYKFTSVGGPSTINELAFTVTANTIDHITLGTGSSAPVAYPNGTVATFKGLSIVVPNTAQGISQDVYISYSTVGALSGGVPSGTTSSIDLTSVKYSGGNGSATESTVVSGTNYAAVLTASTPTVKKTSSGTYLGAGAASNVKVGSIQIAANGGDVSIGNVPFTIGSPTGGVPANVIVKVANVVPTGITATTSGFSFASGYTIASGSSVTFDVYADLGTITTAGNADLTLGTGANFKWSDIVDGKSATTAALMAKDGVLLTTYNQ